MDVVRELVQHEDLDTLETMNIVSMIELLI